MGMGVKTCCDWRVNLCPPGSRRVSRRNAFKQDVKNKGRKKRWRFDIARIIALWSQVQLNCVTTVLQGMSIVWDCLDRLSSTLSKIQITARTKRRLNTCVSIHLDQHPILHPANVTNWNIAVSGQHLALQPSQSPPDNVTLQSSEGAHRPASMDLPVVDIHQKQLSPCWSRCYHQQQVNTHSR